MRYVKLISCEVKPSSSGLRSTGICFCFDTNTRVETHTGTGGHYVDCTYRYQLPVPFGGRLVSKRQEGGGGGDWGRDTDRKSSRQVRGIRLSVIRETSTTDRRQ